MHVKGDDPGGSGEGVPDQYALSSELEVGMSSDRNVRGMGRQFVPVASHDGRIGGGRC